MLERTIIFIVLGVFVFTPAASYWWGKSFTAWIDIYIPWIFLLLATMWLHWQIKRNTNFAEETTLKGSPEDTPAHNEKLDQENLFGKVD
ncbi:MAG: hypothetical protein VB957_02475 [Pseudomonadales bacterium]